MAEAVKAPGGQLAAAKATLYACPAGKTALFLFAAATNTNAAARTWNLYRHDGTASRRLVPVARNIDGSHSDYFRGPVGLVAGDLIEGDASVANQVDFSLTIIEITP
jgi:hypothetical protein